MNIRVLPDELINQIAAGEVVERPSSVVKELCENALDAGASQIVIDVVDGGRTLISITDNGTGMTRDNLARSVMRHATSKLQTNDLLNINTMGFRGEAIPSIASVSDMTIDTRHADGNGGLCLDCTTLEIKPSSWESGTRVRVQNLFSKTPARLKFLRSDRAEMMSVIEIVKRIALSRPDVGFVLNQKWRYPAGQNLAMRIQSIMGDETGGRMLDIDAVEGDLKLTGFISEPTMRRASSIDQYMFVNGRPVRDKLLISSLRAAYFDVMKPSEFPLCALYIELPTSDVDVNVHPAKTEVHFLEPVRVRSFLIRNIRNALSKTLIGDNQNMSPVSFMENAMTQSFAPRHDFSRVAEPVRNIGPMDFLGGAQYVQPHQNIRIEPELNIESPDRPLGRVVGQIGNKYIISEVENGFIITDQHAAHERITYEKMRRREIRRQPLLVPIVINLRPEEVDAIIEVSASLADSGLLVEQFGDTAVAISEKPADWDLDWTRVLRDIAAEVMAHGQSTTLSERLHLKLANHACHWSVRAGQRLDMAQMEALLRDIENTERAGQCNHGRPVYKFVSLAELDGMFERV